MFMDELDVVSFLIILVLIYYKLVKKWRYGNLTR